jgi:hypothetical protein
LYALEACSDVGAALAPLPLDVPSGSQVLAQVLRTGVAEDLAYVTLRLDIRDAVRLNLVLFAVSATSGHLMSVSSAVDVSLEVTRDTSALTGGKIAMALKIGSALNPEPSVMHCPDCIIGREFNRQPGL